MVGKICEKGRSDDNVCSPHTGPVQKSARQSGIADFALSPLGTANSLVRRGQCDVSTAQRRTSAFAAARGDKSAGRRKHPQNRKQTNIYIALSSEEDRPTATGNMNRKFREVWTCGPCPVSKRLAKQLSKKKFRFIRINWKAPSGKFLLT